MAPDGNNSEHIHSLRNKAQHWANNISHMGNNTEEIWTALHRTIPFRIRYSLPAVTLQEKECCYIMAPIHKEGLPRAGIPSTIPSALRHGPTDRGGLGLLDLYTYQGTSQVASLVSNVWAKNPTGKLLQIAIDDISLEMGIPKLSTRHISKGLGYTTTQSWIKHVFNFIEEMNLRITNLRPAMLPPREGDVTIMQLALEYTASTNHLRAINKVRMALNVFWISEICIADGTHIETTWMKKEPHIRQRNSFQWPRQQSSNDWTHWRRFLQHSARRLPALGSWQGNHEDWINHWDAFVNDSEEQLFIRRHDGMWKRHVRYEDRRRWEQKYYTDFLIFHQLPPHQNYKRATFKTHRQHILATSIFNTRRSHTDQEYVLDHQIPSTKEAILRRIQHLLEPNSLEASQDINLLLRDFTNGTVIAISDGSHFPSLHKAAGAWLVESRCRSQWIMGSMTCPGHPNIFNSFRSELVGLIGSSITLQTLSRCVNPPQGLIIGCDGDAALDTLSIPQERINTNLKHWDLIGILNDIWTSMDSKPIKAYVKGHQDTGRQQLTRLEHMNILMDRLAKNTAMLQPARQEIGGLNRIGIPRVYKDDLPMSEPLQKSLYYGLINDRLMGYLTRKLSVDPAQIGWMAFQKARHTTGMVTNTFISKWLSNTVPTGKVLQL